MAAESHPKMHEPAAIPGRLLLRVVFGIAVFLALSLAVLWQFYSAADVPDREVIAVFPPPGVDTAPTAELSLSLLRQRGELAGGAPAAVPDAPPGLPIEEAMRRLVARGANAYAPFEGAQQPESRR